MNRNDSLGLLCAILGAVGFAFKAIFIKAAYQYGVDAETLLALRMGYALPFFIVMGITVAHQAPLRLSARDIGLLALLGFLGYYLASYLDFLGLKYISAALERILLFVYPTLVLLMSAVFLGKPLRWNVLPPLLLCYAGVALAVGHDVSMSGEGVALGSALVFASSLSYACYLMISGETVQRLGSTRVTAWATGFACLYSLAQFAAVRPLAALAQPWQVHALGMAMAVFSTVLPIWLVAEGMRRIGAARTSMIGSLGPVLTILLAAAFLGETLGALQILGTALVMLGVSQVSKLGKR